jgi:hypothetical protein
LRLYKSILIIGGNGDVGPDAEDDSLEDELNKLVDESTPSHEARRITNGKSKENRFIIRNSQGDLK